MMIIDADCHISSTKFDDVAITADELIERMDRSGVDRALVWLAPPYDRNIERENEAVYHAVQKYPQRLLALGWANPRLGHGRTMDTIKRCFEEYGFMGIKFNGAQDDYVIDDPKTTLPYIEAALEYGRPVAFHIGADFPENTHPYRLGHIAGAYPDAQFLMVHMGGVATPSLTRSAIEVTELHPNIIIIGSSLKSRAIVSAWERLGYDRFCYGSDTPFDLMDVELARFRVLLAEADEESRRKVMGGNIARVMALGDEDA
jgi:hypothetical protein